MGLEVYYKFILSFVIILIAARIGGELTERYLKQPAVLGELLAGIIISPFALGGLFPDPIILKFAVIPGAFGLQEFNPMEIISQIAVIALLFVSGTETDVRAFRQNIKAGTAVAMGGVIFPFIFGLLATMFIFRGEGVAAWLFMAAILTATSIGVTVRILSGMGRLQTKSGSMVLVAAVVDDVIGIVVLSMVLSMVTTGSLDIVTAVKTMIIGFGAWFALLLFGIRFNKQISHVILSPFRRSGTIPIMAIIIGFLIAYLVTLIGLSPVIGAYIAGLMFSATSEREEIMEGTKPIALFLSPFFFAYLGMQVDIPLLVSNALPAIIFIALAAIGKIIGCYIPARFMGKLEHRKAMIVGIAMIPRGEVGLIIAGIGLLVGAINRDLFGIAVAVSIFTTLITPTLLKPFLKEITPGKVAIQPPANNFQNG